MIRTFSLLTSVAALGLLKEYLLVAGVEHLSFPIVEVHRIVDGGDVHPFNKLLVTELFPVVDV